MKRRSASPGARFMFREVRPRFSSFLRPNFTVRFPYKLLILNEETLPMAPELGYARALFPNPTPER